MTSLLEVDSVSKTYPARRGGTPVYAVRDVSLSVDAGQTLSVVGESGAGKSTVAKLIARLTAPDSGRISLGGVVLTDLTGKALREARRSFQMVFQDPYTSINPQMSVLEAVREPLVLLRGMSKQKSLARAGDLLERVGISTQQFGRHSHEMSGGQLQRVSIARAMGPEPSLVLCDEPVASLDVSTRATVMNLLLDLQIETGVAFVFISHDLALVESISDSVAVLYAGRVVENGLGNEIFDRPRHPYTKQLLAAVPDPAAALSRSGGPTKRLHASDLDAGGGDAQVAMGCAYRDRCPIAEPGCAEREPPLTAVDDRLLACFVLGGVDPVDVSESIDKRGEHHEP